MMRNVIPFLSDGMFDPYFIVTDSAPKCSNDCKCDVNDYNPICLPELGPIVCWSNLAMTCFLDELGLTKDRSVKKETNQNRSNIAVFYWLQ